MEQHSDADMLLVRINFGKDLYHLIKPDLTRSKLSMYSTYEVQGWTV